MYATDDQPLESLFEHICRDLRTAYMEGVTLKDNSKLHLVPLGLKGDWPFLEPCRQSASGLKVGEI